MLHKLSINNFALIDQVEIDFESGLSVITGETGAGKSILLGAISLILGNRADHSALKDNSRKCIVEGIFNISNYKLHAFFEEYDLDYAESTILRREINGNGKSRSFINDTPATLEIMKKLGNQLIDIHSQQQSLQINDPSFQLNVLDSLADNTTVLKDYENSYKRYKALFIELEEIKNRSVEGKKQEDYLNFQFQELETLNLNIGENENLEEEQERFANSEDIIRNLNQIEFALTNSDENILSSLNEVKSLLQNTERFDSSISKLSDRLNGLLIDLQDISDEIEQKANSSTYDPERHQFIEDRLGEIHRLQRKHLLSEADELIHLKSKIESELESISSFELDIEKFNASINQEETELEKLSNQLRKKRLNVIVNFEKRLESTLKLLGMPFAKVQIIHKMLNGFTSNGKDGFDFMFSANKGIEPALVSRSASGGESSRLMLGIKEILAENQQMPTLLFDEIDTGVSGEIAEKVGSILSGMAHKRQIIAITHLPQLTAKGKQHYLVYKEIVDNKSKTQIKKLRVEERIEELAKMLSGKNLTEAALNNAKELLTL